MQKDLVSIITPSYNTGHLIHRLLDSVLMQDYHNLEMIVIDDGSTDNCREVVLGYQRKFADGGMKLEYQYQQNGGQSVAINNALKWVKGEFLLWPDADDFYNRPDILSTYVKCFRELPDEYGMVKSIPKYVYENSLLEMPYYINDIDMGDSQFENALFNRHFPWNNYMVRMSAFDTTNPCREIYTQKKAGQNWQMVLPLLYSYKCKTLNENFFSVLVRSNSHSRRSSDSLADAIEHISVYEDTILNTLDRINEMSLPTREHYKMMIRQKYSREKFYLCCGYKDLRQAKRFKKELTDAHGTLTKKEYVKYLLVHFPFLYSLLQKD